MMTALKQEELLDEIDLLPIDLKTKIVDKILTSITPANSEIDQLWVHEARKRKKEIESDCVALVDGDEVFKKIAQKINS